MRLAPVSPNHPEHLAASQDQRRGLHGSVAGLPMSVQGRCSNEEGTSLDVRHDHSMANTSGNGTRGPALRTVQFEDLAEFRVESPPCQHPESVSILIDDLHALGP